MNFNLIINLLKKEIKAKGVRSFSNSIGISTATLSRIQNGKDFDLKTLEKIINYYQLSEKEICSLFNKTEIWFEENQVQISIKKLNHNQLKVLDNFINFLVWKEK